MLASGCVGNTIRLWDTQERKQVGLLAGHKAGNKYTGVYSLAFRPGGKLLASGGADETVRLWDVDKQEQVWLMEGHTDLVSSLAFSPDGALLASGSYDSTV